MSETVPFSANILSAIRFTQTIDSQKTHKRYSTDYELDYYISGNRTMSINGKSFIVGFGSVVFRRPGDYTVSNGNYNCYCLNLDFSRKKTNKINTYDRNDSNQMQETSSNPLLDYIPSHFVSHHSTDYIKIIEKLLYNQQLIQNQASNDILLNQLFFLILSDIYYQKANMDESETNKIFTESCKYIQENFHKQISIKELADNVSLSSSYFLKIFKKLANITPTEYIISIRLANAKRFLSETDLTISQIAEQCGYADASYFSYYFKKSFGITPGEYRLNQRLDVKAKSEIYKAKK